MALVTIRQRRDGVPQITRDDDHAPAEQRHLVMATIFFVASGFFLSGFAPFILVAGLTFAFAIGEAIMLVDALVRRRGPPAEVRELVRASSRQR